MLQHSLSDSETVAGQYRGTELCDHGEHTGSHSDCFVHPLSLWVSVETNVGACAAHLVYEYAVIDKLILPRACHPVFH